MSIFGFMHEYWIISHVNVTYIRLKFYTNMVVNEHEIQTFKIVVIVLLFLLLLFEFPPHKCTSFIIHGQVIYLNILKCQFYYCVLCPMHSLL